MADTSRRGPERMLTEAEAARYVRLGVHRFRRACPVPPVGIDGALRWDRRKIDRWLDGLQRMQADPAANPAPGSADDMTRVRVRGFQIFRDRLGKMRCYHRETRQPIDLEKTPLGSAGFLAACARIQGILDERKAKESRATTLRDLVQAWLGSDRYRNYSPSTRTTYRLSLDLLEPYSDTPVGGIDTPVVSEWLDKAAEANGWSQSNRLRMILLQIFKHALPLGLVRHNPVRDTIPKQRPKALGYANRPWTREECRVVLSRVPAHLRIAIALIMNTGLDPTDAIRLRRDQIVDGTIWTTRAKTGNRVAVPISAPLQRELDAAPEHCAETVLATSRGETWTYNGISSSWSAVRRALEAEGLVAPGLTLKGLRHTVATTLREFGLDERAIADLLGQKKQTMALHYSRSAVLEEKNRKTVEALVEARNDGDHLANLAANPANGKKNKASE